ncbi:MAG: imidazolonepropionase, partial [Treponema sp.]|nr:imidazolonepropionase [Treponema sp.]
MAKDLYIRDIAELATPTGRAARRGKDMADVLVVPDAAVLIRDGTVAWAGPAAEAPAVPPGVPVLSARGGTVVPGFVDSHTHFVFAGDRSEEFLWRAGGLPYMEIHRRGGGIRRSMDATRAASREELVEIGRKRLRTMLSLGITTVEGKSGYGMNLETELRQLEAMEILGREQPVRIVPTFLGPHSTPPEYAGRTSEFMDAVIRDMLPAVKARGLARFCDVFCEKGVFELADSRRYLEAAKAAGFGLKVHADEIERIGGAALAAELGAASADHLLKCVPSDYEALARSSTVATCLPLTAFVLREPYADARGMIDAGCAVALASDLNPGSCYSQSIPLIFALAVLYMRLSVDEALCALTLNGAAALGLASEVGSLEPGKRGDLVILD